MNTHSGARVAHALVSRDLLDRVDRHRKTMPPRPSGTPPTRADAIRDLLQRGLEATRRAA